MSAIDTMPISWLWLHLVLLGLATYALRSSFIALFSYFDMPDYIENHLDLVPPAVFAALAVPPLVFRGGTYHLSPMNPYLLAGIAAAIVAWETESLFGTIAVGLLMYIGVTYVLII